jgi:hypothetical protein
VIISGRQRRVGGCFVDRRSFVHGNGCDPDDRDPQRRGAVCARFRFKRIGEPDETKGTRVPRGVRDACAPNQSFRERHQRWVHGHGHWRESVGAATINLRPKGDAQRVDLAT